MIDPDLLEHIYDVVLSHSSWDEVLMRLRTEFSAEAGLMVAYGQGPTAIGTLCWSGHDDCVVRAYKQHFGALNPYVRMMRSGSVPPGKVAFGDDLVPGKVLRASEFYRDWFRPNGMRYALGGDVRGRDGRDLMVGMPRSEAAGPYTPDEIRTFQAYFDHIRRALEIQEALGVRIGPPDFDRIAVRYRLTPAEVRLLELLAEIGGLKKCAQRLGRSYHTLRAQLRAVLQKTGTHSQVQLIRLIHRTAPD
jgi:DNA-binding CsgD family transcriptional regulator